MKVTGTSPEGFEQAFADAVAQAPREGDVPRTYELKRSWFDDGGIVGPRYHCEVEVTGP